MSHSWWEIQIHCDPALEELIFWRLENFGCHGTASEQKGQSRFLRAYLPQINGHQWDLEALSISLRQDALALGLLPPTVEWHSLDEEDWANSWKQYWKPQEIGDRFLIYPAWLSPPPSSERMILRLDPGAAFGTGVHSTTQLCLEALEMHMGDNTNQGAVIADIGCGSGILSIGAILLGAKKVYAVDVDPLAVDATYHNRDLNRIDSQRLAVDQGSIEQLTKPTQAPVDGILCNILAEVIIDLIPQMSAITKPNSWGILSGILLEQAKLVADTLEQQDWIVKTLWKRQDWCCFEIRRS